MASSENTTLDPEEVERFTRMAEEWWDPKGKFRPLHRMNPVRLSYVKEQLCSHFGRSFRARDALADLKLLDVGCGGGLLSEPLARLGAQMTGIDPSERNIQVAALHAEKQKLAICYHAATAETLAEEGRQFDAVICLEVVEHVPDVTAFLAVMAKLVKPGGLLVLSTINRTVKSFALAIIGAEYVLQWLPRGTHQWHRFVTPSELQEAAEAAGLSICDSRGATYNPLFDEWRLSATDQDVNYFMTCTRPLANPSKAG